MVKKHKASFRKTRQPVPLSEIPDSEPQIEEKTEQEEMEDKTSPEFETNSSPEIVPNFSSSFEEVEMVDSSIPIVDDPLPWIRSSAPSVTEAVPEIDPKSSPVFETKSSPEIEKKPNSEAEPNSEAAGTGLVQTPKVVRIDPPRSLEQNASREIPHRGSTSQSNGMMKMAIVAGGAILGLGILFMMFSGKGKKKESGPTIVEVTEVSKEEKRSEKSDVINNKMSSPRIIFGNVRKNPKLAVAPPVSQT